MFLKLKDLSKNLILLGLTFFAIFAGTIAQNSFGQIEALSQVASTKPILYEGKATYRIECKSGLDASGTCTENGATGCKSVVGTYTCDSPGSATSVTKEVIFKKEDCGGDNKSFCASKDGVVYVDCTDEGICRKEAPKTGGRYYTEKEHNGITCKIYISGNGYYSGNVFGTGKTCGTAESDQKCTFLNPNEKSFSGQKNIQVGCNPINYTGFKDGGTLVVWDQFNNDSSGRTVVTKLNDGKQITLSDDDLATICGGGEFLGGLWTEQCKSITKDEFAKKLQEFCETKGDTNCSAVKDPKTSITPDTLATDTTKIDTKDDTTTAATESDKTPEALDPIGDGLKGAVNIIIGLVVIIITAIAWVLGAFGLVAVFLMGWLSLIIMLINPASPANVVVAAEVWGIFAGIANLIAFGSIVFFGLMKVLDVKGYSDKTVGDFILKVIFYAVLINFTLLTTAAIVNIGYSFGILLIVSRGGDPTDLNEMAQILMGDILASIARFSYLRCGDDQECSTIGPSNIIEVSGRGWGKTTNAVGKGFGDNLGSLVGNAVGEILFFFLLVVTMGAFIKLFKVVLFRLLAVWVLMITSPVALASYFSGIDEWQSFGKQWLDRLVTAVLFFPMVIFSLIMISLMSGAFGGVLDTGDVFGTAGGGSTNSGGLSFGEDFNTMIGFVIKNIIAGAFTVGGLYAVAGYFEEKFKGDIDTLKSGSGELWQGAKDFAYKTPVAAGARLFNNTWGKGLANSKYGKKTTEWLNEAAKGKKIPGGRLIAGLTRGTSRLARNTLEGKILHIAEGKLETVKKLADGFSKISEGDIKGELAEDQARDVIFAKQIPLIGNAVTELANRTDLAGRGVTGRDWGQLEQESKPGESWRETYLADIRSQASGALVSDETKIPEELAFRRLKDLSAVINQGGTYDQDSLKDLINGSYTNNKLMEAIAIDPALRKEVARLYEGPGFSEKAQKELADKYGSLIYSDTNSTDLKNRAQRNAAEYQKNLYTPSSADLLNDQYREIFEQKLEEITVNDGGRESTSYRAYESVRSAARSRGQRAYDNMNRNVPTSNRFVTEGISSNDIVISSEDARNISTNNNIDLTQNYNSETELNQVMTQSPELTNVYTQAVNQAGGNVQAGYGAVRRSLNVARAVDQVRTNNVGRDLQLGALEDLIDGRTTQNNPLTQQRVGRELVKDLVLEDIKGAIFQSYVDAGRGTAESVRQNPTYQRKAEEYSKKAYAKVMAGDLAGAGTVLDRAGGQPGIAGGIITARTGTWNSLAETAGDDYLKDQSGTPLTLDALRRRREQLIIQSQSEEENAARNANRANPTQDPRNP